MIREDLDEFFCLFAEDGAFFGNEAELALEVFFDGDLYGAVDMLHVGLVLIRHIDDQRYAVVVDELFFVDLLMFDQTHMIGG